MIFKYDFNGTLIMNLIMTNVLGEQYNWDWKERYSWFSSLFVVGPSLGILLQFDIFKEHGAKLLQEIDLQYSVAFRPSRL